MTEKNKRFGMWFLAGALIVSLAGLVGCGGGGEEAAPALGVFTKTVVQAGADNVITVFDNNDTSTKVQMLLKADDVDGSGFVRSMSLRFSGASTGSVVQNVTIKMGHTSIVDNLTTTFASNVENGSGSLVTVFGPAALAIPAGADNTWFTIPLTANAFNYNGVDDLVIQVTTGTSTKRIKATGHATAYDALLFSDNSAAAAGVLQQALPDVKVTFAGGVDRLEYTFENNGNLIPFTTSAGLQKAQFLYAAKDIDGSGQITGIGFQVTNLGVGPVSDVKFRYTVRLAHTKLGGLKTAFDNNFNAGAPVKVADNVTFTYNAGLPDFEWFWLPISTPFTYNGTDNLIVEITIHSATGDVYLSRDTGGVNTRLYGAAGDNVGTLDVRRAFTRFRFAGGTMDLVTAGATTDLAPFNFGDNSTINYLYRNVELGSKQTISKLGMRVTANVTADKSIPNLVIKMGHSDNVAMVVGTTFSGYMSGAQTVFNGTFVIPAGLKAGDWVDIPLSAPFAYNPSRNLVVQTIAPAASSGVGVAAAFSPEFPGRYAFRNSLTIDNVATVLGALRDARFR